MNPVAHLTADQIEQQLIEGEAIVARVRAKQADLLAEADRRQLPTGDGCRTLAEWTSTRLDVSSDTARDLVRIARNHYHDVRKRLDCGEWSFDRSVASHRWITTGAPEEHVVAESTRYDIGGLRTRAALARRMTPAEEEAAFAGRYLVTQRSLDRTFGRLWGQLPGDDMDRVEQRLTTTADSFPAMPDGTKPNRAQRLADALVALTTGQVPAYDLDRGDAPRGDALPADMGLDLRSRPQGTLSVFVDAGAGHTSGGYTVGNSVIEELMCDAHHETTALQADGTAVETGGRNTVTDRQRRRIQYLHKTCAADGCQSRYRLQVHHRTWQASGGTHHDTNLTLLCWYHHHVVIHRSRFTIDPTSPPHRLRFVRPATRPPPQRE